MAPMPKNGQLLSVAATQKPPNSRNSQILLAPGPTQETSFSGLGIQEVV